jgi:hypothetical protein
MLLRRRERRKCRQRGSVRAAVTGSALHRRGLLREGKAVEIVLTSAGGALLLVVVVAPRRSLLLLSAGPSGVAKGLPKDAALRSRDRLRGRSAPPPFGGESTKTGADVEACGFSADAGVPPVAWSCGFRTTFFGTSSALSWRSSSAGNASCGGGGVVSAAAPDAWSRSAVAIELCRRCRCCSAWYLERRPRNVSAGPPDAAGAPDTALTRVVGRLAASGSASVAAV